MRQISDIIVNQSNPANLQLSQNIKDEYLDDLEYYTKLFDIKGTQEGAYDVAGLIEGWRNQ